VVSDFVSERADQVQHEQRRNFYVLTRSTDDSHYQEEV
jgi:hypothetical protein